MLRLCTALDCSVIMSFRKRNAVIASPSGASGLSRQEKTLAQGVRPSPLDGRLTTSTGTQSLDQLLAGHAGLALGNSLLIEETGATDFGGVLLRYYAAEGLVQGHHVHVLGVEEAWRRELPGLSSESKPATVRVEPAVEDRMKIAWRYETFGSTPTPNRSRFVSAGCTRS